MQNIVSNPLTNQSLTIPLEEQYSYIYQGNAQILDHCLTTDFQELTVEKLQYVRANADNPEFYVDEIFPNFRTSDHDGYVLFLELGSPILSKNENIYPSEKLKVFYPNPFKSDDFVTIESKVSEELNIKLITVDGKLVWEKNQSILTNESLNVTLPLQNTQQVYFLVINGEKTNFTGKLIFKS